MTKENAETVKAKALARLVRELKVDDECTEHYEEKDVLRLLGVDQ